MPLQPGDLMFVGWDSDSNDIAFVATTELVAGEVIYFTDNEWNGSNFIGNEQLIEWTVPSGGIAAGSVVTIDMVTGPGGATIDAGGTVDYIRGGGSIAGANEMFWAFQGTRVGSTVTPDNFVAVIGNEADGPDTQTPNLSGTGLTTSTGAIIIDGDNDFMEFDESGLPSPVTQAGLIAAISDTSSWILDNGRGNNNPNPGGGFDIAPPFVVCFVRGTLLRTPLGEVAVECLKIGDLVTTQDNGVQPVRWIATTHARCDASQSPVLFRAGSCGNKRDLQVSPQHRMLVSGLHADVLFGEPEVLVPAKSLIDGWNVIKRPPGNVVYVHVMFDRHEIIFAEGAATESFYPGPQSIKALNKDARQDLLARFPELEDGAATYGALARLCVKTSHARLLLAPKTSSLSTTLH